jgi:hypothetical protein
LNVSILIGTDAVTGLFGQAIGVPPTFLVARDDGS